MKREDRVKGGGMSAINSREEFINAVAKKQGWQLFVFYTETSAKSMQLLEEFKKWENPPNDVSLYSINASQIRDIHPDYGITSVPVVLVFKNGEKINLIYGFQNVGYYEDLLVDPEPSSVHPGDSEKKVKRIVVYTSDSCPWCNKAKDYLKGLKMPFKEVNVSRNPAEADKLVKRTGQTGTPQLDINGKYVVGFDKPKIDALLGIRGA
jgi:glutaredoxin-like YruB-family protein